MGDTATRVARPRTPTPKVAAVIVPTLGRIVHVFCRRNDQTYMRLAGLVNKEWDDGSTDISVTLFNEDGSTEGQARVPYKGHERDMSFGWQWPEVK